MSTVQMHQIIEMFFEDCKSRGIKFKDGAKDAVVRSALSVWDIRNDHKILDAIDTEAKKWIIPKGLMMPWGKIVPIKAKRA